MKSLYISIIITVFGSLFFISWALDELVDYSTTDNVSETQKITVYRHLIDGLTNELDTLNREQLQDRISQFQSQYRIKTKLALSKKIALPSSLASQLYQQGGLLLATEANQYLLKSIPKHPKYLLRIELPADKKDNESLNFILTLILYLSICGAFIIWLIPLTRRLYLLNNAAAKIGTGQFDVRIAKSKLSYIKVLEKSFNTMADKIETLIADNKILAHSLSHDIRTPMACLRFGIEAALDSQTREQKDLYLSRMDNELTNMENMTAIFLDYASMERQALNLHKQSVDVSSLITTTIHDCEIIATKRGIHIDESILDAQATLHIDYHWVYRALVNLISNATSYAQSRIIVQLEKKHNDIIITVADDGKGIDEAKVDVIFQPFVKLDNDRNRENGHFGLGLAVCVKVMDWHQGEISVTNGGLLHGANFTLAFRTS